MATLDDELGPGRAAQSAIYRAGVSGRMPRIPVRWPELIAKAERSMTAEAWAYVHGSAGLETTAEANANAFDDWRIVPRVLRDVRDRDLGVELFGHRYPTPLLAAPVGVLELVDPDADLAIARAAATLGVPAVISTQASVPMERIAAEGGGGPLWYQLYWSSDDELVESLVRRAEAIGVHALEVTLDTQQLGWRPRDLDRAYLPFIRGMGIAQYTSDPVFQRLVAARQAGRRDGSIPAGPSVRVTPAAIRTLLGLRRRGVAREAGEVFLEVFTRQGLTWSDLGFLRERTSLPILLKGIQHPDDARRARDAGVDGIVVSNHAGRQVDGAIGALEALPGVVDAVKGAMPVLYDSGVRSGADVFRALALGAAAVQVGRPWVYGMAIAGEEGAREALRNLIAEFDLTLGLAGRRTVAELDRADLAR
ncbi:MAG TPA: alpha-hydroxy-acid oxidizing protein [Pseudolysinimonas sp.]|jgi:isopentenyl diphosphate isomerase/L-lactate dehydrogenase-like FMN-dependent dehydrogenase|nr:alpha-hydroxy-acid oxidizing protein [Pseudolysinimonas sp.]